MRIWLMFWGTGIKKPVQIVQPTPFFTSQKEEIMNPGRWLLLLLLSFFTALNLLIG